MTYLQLTSNSPRLSAWLRDVARQLPDVLDEAVHQSALDAQQMYQKTTATWNTQPTFEVERENTGRWAVRTDDPRYGWIDKGTRAHYIPLSPKSDGFLTFRWPSSPKTKVNVISSFRGSPGSKWARKKQVWNKGIKARGFSRIIAQRAQAPTANRLRAALRQAVTGSGAGL